MLQVYLMLKLSYAVLKQIGFKTGNPQVGFSHTVPGTGAC